jgi:hypothetical protein
LNLSSTGAQAEAGMPLQQAAEAGQGLVFTETLSGDCFALAIQVIEFP